MLPKPLLPWLILGWVLSVGAASAGSYFYAWNASAEQCELDSLRIGRAAAAARDKAIEAAAQEIAKIDIRHTTINRKVEREIVEKPVYKECRHSPEVFMSITEAMSP